MTCDNMSDFKCLACHFDSHNVPLSPFCVKKERMQFVTFNIHSSQLHVDFYHAR